MNDATHRSTARPSLTALLAAVGLLVLLLAWAPSSANAASIKNIQYAPNVDPALLLDVHGANMRHGAPVMLLVHGGGWRNSDKKEWIRYGWSQAFVRAGFVVVNVNYRLACDPEHVPRERNGVKPDARLCGHSLPEEVADVETAIDWTYRNVRGYGGDPTKIVLAGGSAGAHLVLTAAASPSHSAPVRGVVAISAPVDLRTFKARSARLYDAVHTVIGCGILECNESWTKFSPMSMVQENPLTPPATYLLQSRNDSRVPYVTVKRFANILRGLGGDVTLREPANRASDCHGPWDCDRFAMAGTNRHAQADVIDWIRSRTR